MDPTVSREHARLVLNQDGWHIINLTVKNVVRVNGRPVPSGSNLPMKPEDVLILGSTMLQLIAPQTVPLANPDMNAQLDHDGEITEIYLAQRRPKPPSSNGVSVERDRQTPPSLPVLPPASPQLPAHSMQPNAQASPSEDSFATRERWRDASAQFPLPVQPDPDQEPHWSHFQEESVLGAA